MTAVEMLQFDWESILEIPISAVVGRRDEAGEWATVAFFVGTRAVVLTVNGDTDEIVVSLEAASDTSDWDEFAALSHVVGRPFGWSWCATNWRGYRDAFVVAFGDTVPDAQEPRVMFLGEGSRLYCLTLTPLRN